MTEPTWHVFFDTTEISKWAVLRPELGTLAHERGAKGIVSSLVVEEVVCQMLRDITSHYSRLRSAASGVRDYVSLTIGSLAGEEELVGRLRSEVKAKMPSWIREIPTSNVALDDLLQMSTRRVQPFRGDKDDKDPTGLHDAVILLSYIAFARTERLSRCVFVSRNRRDHSAESVKALARRARHDGTWVFVVGTDDLLQFLRDPELTQSVTQALNDNVGAIEEYLAGTLWPEMRQMMIEHGRLSDTGVAQSSFHVESVSAKLDTPLQEDGECGVSFDAVVPVVVEGTLKPVTIAGGLTRVTTSVFKFDFLIEGQAVVTLEDRRIIGPPRIRSAGLVSMTDLPS